MPQDKDALLRELVEKYLKRCMRLANGKGVPQDYAEDVVMDAFMSLYNSDRFAELANGSDSVAVELLLARITINKSIDFLRKSGAVDRVSLDDCENFHRTATVADFGRSPEDIALEKENIERFSAFIDGMKDIWRDLARMYFIEELSPSEICGILGISKDLFRSRLSRIRSYIRKRHNETQNAN